MELQNDKDIKQRSTEVDRHSELIAKMACWSVEALTSLGKNESDRKMISSILDYCKSIEQSYRDTNSEIEMHFHQVFVMLSDLELHIESNRTENALNAIGDIKKYLSFLEDSVYDYQKIAENNTLPTVHQQFKLQPITRSRYFSTDEN